MSELKKLFESLNIPNDKVLKLIEAVKTNPMSALALVGELNIPPQVMQQMMGIAMTNPAELMNLAKELGVSEDLVKDVKSKVLDTKKD